MKVFRFESVRHLLYWVANNATGPIRPNDLSERQTRGRSGENCEGEAALYLAVIRRLIADFPHEKRRAFEIVWIEYWRELRDCPTVNRREEIERASPIQRAAKELKRPYRTIWGWIEDVEQHLENEFRLDGEIEPRPQAEHPAY